MTISKATIQALIVIFGVMFALDVIVGVVLAEQIDSGPFFLFTALVSVASAIAVIQPKEIGHALATLTGCAALVGAVASAMAGMPMVMPVVLFVCGGFMPFLAYRSWHGSRVSWSFLTTMCGVLGVCMLFGAPKVKHLLHIGLWPALVFPGILAATTVALAVQHPTYRHQID
jgi:uncharacterized membrane protein (UPF0136 family)